MSFVLFRMHGKNTPPFTSINYVMYIDNVHVIVRIQSVKWQFWLISSATQIHCLSFQKSYLSFTQNKIPSRLQASFSNDHWYEFNELLLSWKEHDQLSDCCVERYIGTVGWSLSSKER